MKSDAFHTLISEIDNDSLVLALLCAMQEDSMVRLIEACVEMDPEHRAGVTSLVNGLQTFTDEAQESEVSDQPVAISAA